MSRILSALAIALSLVSGAIADDPVLDFGVFDPMPSVVSASDSAPLDFDVFGCGQTVTVKPAKLEPYVSKPGGYPLRQNLCSGLPKNKLDAVVHLSTGEHAGKYDLKWLARLTWDELNSLHSDDHEGCVSPSAKMVKVAVPGPPKVEPAKPQPQPVTQSTPQCTTYWNGRQWVRVCR